MRRGVGVGHIHAKKIQADKMSNLGAQLSAERVGQLSNQIDRLTEQIIAIAADHDSEISRDPVARAKLVYLAEALQVDLNLTSSNHHSSSSSEKIGKEKTSELQTYHSQLAARVISVCKSESVYAGALIPLSGVIQALERDQRNRTGTTSHQRHRPITEEDVRAALREVASVCEAALLNNGATIPPQQPHSKASSLHTSGRSDTSNIAAASLFTVVSIGGDPHVKVAPVVENATTASVDAVELLRLVTNQFIGTRKRTPASSTLHANSTTVRNLYAGPGMSSRVGRLAAHRNDTIPSGDNAVDQPEGYEVPPHPSYTLEEIMKMVPLTWSEARGLVALQQLLTNGSAWMDVPPPGTSVAPSFSTTKVQARRQKEDEDFVFLSGGHGHVGRGERNPAAIPPGPIAVLHTPGATFWFVDLLNHMDL